MIIDRRRKVSGVIGITDSGYPIVTDTHACPYWEAGARGGYQMRECWYCRYADFRKTVDTTLSQSICRYPRNRVSILPNAENENYEEVQSI